MTLRPMLRPALRRSIALVLAIAIPGACELDIDNPNAAPEEGVLTTIAGLRALAIGMQGKFGNSLEEGIYIPGLISGELGNTNATQSTTREFQNFPTPSANSAIDPTNIDVLDLWVKNYVVVKAANQILANVDAVGFLPPTRSGIVALAKLHKAMAYGQLIEAFEQIPLAEGDNPPFSNRAQVLAEILSLLASAKADFLGTPPSTEFTNTILAPGFDLLNTIRAMQARYSLAAGAYTAALGFANEVPSTAASSVIQSSLDANVLRDLYHGSRFFGAISSYRTNAEAGDTRVNANTMATALTGFGGATLVETNLFLTVSSPIPLFSQDELTLIRAEAYARNNQLAEARTEINIVRARAGLLPKTAVDLPTQQAVLDEIYRQRTYSLFSTGLHWADQRRFGRIAEAKVRYLPYPFAERATNTNTPPNPGP